MTNGNNGGEGRTGALPPELHVLAQYIKDLSFENPNAPQSLVSVNNQQPKIDIQINVNATPLGNTDFEVVLHVEGKAMHEGSLAFGIELSFAGVFRLQNVPQDSIRPAVMIECPRILFPFAREIIATAVRNGGFPPLLLDPVDFVGLYRQNVAAQAAGMQPPPAG
ncbi:MAG TPA: protein-export chaperone SecB [Xanthobacteraceae bacterium]|nr:protein-export chaperone SecB [Xanthobacteraceae bacterium]